ncbi:MAG: hypothetical protein EOP04_30905 [Proteobacteria bacterium]|nr:MAG: hypothetical protein EOP04_30905 [Pseudomonadota bacterium]
MRNHTNFFGMHSTSVLAFFLSGILLTACDPPAEKSGWQNYYVDLLNETSSDAEIEIEAVIGKHGDKVVETIVALGAGEGGTYLSLKERRVGMYGDKSYHYGVRFSQVTKNAFTICQNLPGTGYTFKDKGMDCPSDSTRDDEE